MMSSMIGDDRQSAKLFENGSLLDDLMQYVDAGSNCKLLLVGDPGSTSASSFDNKPCFRRRLFRKTVQ